MSYELKLFSGNANRPLAEEIATTLQLPLGDAEVSRFSDGEVDVEITRTCAAWTSSSSSRPARRPTTT